MKLTVKNIEQETADTVSISFKNGGFFNKLNYKPGQFVTLHFNLDDKIHKRAYSFSSNPFTDKEPKITIKRVENGLVSNYMHDSLKVGDKLQIDKPDGSFFVIPEKAQQKDYVFFAGGSGITPIFSIINSVLTKEPKSKIILIYANRFLNSIIFKEKLDKLQKEYGERFKIEFLISKEMPVLHNYHHGLITDGIVMDVLEKYNLAFKNGQYMICGPFGFMEAVKSILFVNGVSSTKIKEELFKRPDRVVLKNGVLSKVKIQLKGESHELSMENDTTILQAAMANNIEMPYSCRSGMCSTCLASCVSGDISMTEGHFLEQKDVDAGKILTCVSYPASENVVISI
ncbi:2Fe-2S iron-sulfur cluster-binding protein [Maribacter sp. SA7]|uniref:2Fe-2S iron-sulfur cluster-binding protein n=1 Tax=Maribacter zhoushanensis TaxID=3030012 RepID=UPI0023ED44D8|nr:2Fe-2S iron-sulfur cluster-binding protein [Maribacter zhoushanensis]MDF4201375.1 2Fe-2S iron-sulfur cluster-binding protein [Maribacter zhoushanensis]